VDNYKEVKIGESFQSVDELAEVAYDVGVQLGRGHVKQIGAPFDLQIRLNQLEMVEKYEQEMKQARRQLAEQTVAAWKKFRDRVDENYSVSNN
jgi:hypothetical protein